MTVKELKETLDTMSDSLQVQVSSDGSNVTPVAEVSSCVDMDTNKFFCYIGGAWRGMKQKQTSDEEDVPTFKVLEMLAEWGSDRVKIEVCDNEWIIKKLNGELLFAISDLHIAS